MSQAGQPGNRLREILDAIKAPSIPVVADGSHEHCGIQLADAIQDCRSAEFGRHAADDSADRQGSQGADQCVDAHWQDQHDAISGAHSTRAQNGGELRHSRDEDIASELSKDLDAAGMLT